MNQKSEKDNVFINSKWIGCSKECQSPVIIRRFNIKNIKNATLKITGLGYFEARVNGKNVCEDRLIPVVSDYEKRSTDKFLYPIYDEFTYRIYYYTYDITGLLNDGDNILEIQLGNGWYRQTERTAEGPVSFGDRLKAIYSLTIADDCGSRELCSDGSENWKESEITYNNLFIGEIWDCTKFCVDEKSVEVVEDTNSNFSEQAGTPDRIIRTINPKLIKETGNKKIYDAGENVSGVVRIHTKASKGEKIVLRFAENLNDDLSLNFYSTGSAYVCTSGKNQIMTDSFITDGTKRTFEPKFVWHSFRYFEVDGSIDAAEVVVIHSNVNVTAEFNSSSEGLNFLFDAFLRTQLNNMHGSIPSDCPHRERLGYTGDGQACAKAAMMMTDSREFYRKWIIDILDCQDKKSGHVQHTAPFMGGGGGPGGWGSAIVTVPYAYYRQTDDVSTLKQCYMPMKRWINYLCNHMDNGLITREEENGWCLGDWCTLEPTIIPEPFVNSCYFIKCLRLMSEIAEKIDCTDDIPGYNHLISETAEALKKTYYNKSNGHFCDSVQGADAYAIWCGIGNDAVVKEIADYYDNLGHFDTGFLGTDILLEILFSYGYADTAFKLLDSEELGSFLYMKRGGATTLWETWHGKDSHDHPMFGACSRHLYDNILGISQSEGSCGYKNIVISPKTPQKLEFAEGSINTDYGKIYVKWKRENDNIIFNVSVPDAINAKFEYNEISEIITGNKTIFYSRKK